VVMALRGQLAFLSRGRGRFLLFAALSAGCLVTGARVLAAKLLVLMLYHPSRYLDDPKHSARISAFREAFGKVHHVLDEVAYAEGSQKAWLLQADSRTTGTSVLWVVFGGNAMLATDWLDFLWEFLRRGEVKGAFLLVDYPGYGANTGEPMPDTVLASAQAAIAAAVPKLFTPAGTLNILGHSLGSSAGSMVAAGWRGLPERSDIPWGDTSSCAWSSLTPGRLVLSAPFFNLEAMAQAILFRSVPRWLLRLFVSHRWDSAAWVARAAQNGWQISIIHGALDQIVPSWMGRALRDVVKRNGFACDYIEVPQADHNDVLGVAIADYAALMGFSQ